MNTRRQNNDNCKFIVKKNNKMNLTKRGKNTTLYCISLFCAKGKTQ